MRSSCLCEEPELSKHCQLCQMVVINSFHSLFMAAGADGGIQAYSNIWVFVSKGLLWSPEDLGSMHSENSLALYCYRVAWTLCCRKSVAVMLHFLVWTGNNNKFGSTNLSLTSIWSSEIRISQHSKLLHQFLFPKL